jgi:hypothetical protein
MPDLEFIKQGNKMEKYVNPIQSDDEDQSPYINEKETKDSSFKKLHFDVQNDEYKLDNMMSNLSMNDNKIGNPNIYFVIISNYRIICKEETNLITQEVE